jgi:DNA (cytosine-5)-methyltransferase 1
MKIASLFSGAGGLDLGFRQAGFDIIWANEYDSDIWETYEKNHSETVLDRRSIVDIEAEEVPDCDGIVGGPPCQSWSEAGSMRGIEDTRGQLFFDFIRILAEKQPKFFLAENVPGILHDKHKEALANIKTMFKECGYNLSFALLNSSDYKIPQDRKRVFFIGYRKDLDLNYNFPKSTTGIKNKKITLRQAIGDLKDSVIPAKEKNYSNLDDCKVPNHEYMTGGFSSIFMSRNRVRSWEEQSYTIQAGGRHAPLHPQAPKMEYVKKNKRIFVKGKEHLYRRLSVRECARIQTFPDNFFFYYDKVSNGYKMIGNAVPVRLAKQLALKVKRDLSSIKELMEVETNGLTKEKFNDMSVQERMVEIVTG